MPAASWRSACCCAKRCDYVNQREQNTPCSQSSRGARGGKPPRKESGLSFISREAQIKDSPLFQHQNKGLSCGVRFHHLRTSFSFLAAHGYWAPHTDSDRCEGKCSFKISHHCAPSPELQNPVCFRSIQYIGLTSVDSAEPVF